MFPLQLRLCWWASQISWPNYNILFHKHCYEACLTVWKPLHYTIYCIIGLLHSRQFDLIAGKALVLLITLTMSLFYWSVPVRHYSEPAWTILYQDPETEAADWNSAIINFTIDTCAFPFPSFNMSKCIPWKRPVHCTSVLVEQQIQTIQDSFIILSCEEPLVVKNSTQGVAIFLVQIHLSCQPHSWRVGNNA